MSDRLFGDLSRPAQAYALGVVAGAGRDQGGRIEVRLPGHGEPFVTLLQGESDAPSPPFVILGGDVRLDPPWNALVERWLGAPLRHRDQLHFPELEPALRWAFVRGLFDGSGHINSPQDPLLRLRLERPGARLLEQLLEFLPIQPERVGKRALRWTGHNALDLLGHLYEENANPDSAQPCRRKPFERYVAWAHRVPPFLGADVSPGKLRWTAVHPDARPPFKQRVTDSGYDLTLLYEKKRWGSCVLYGTGLVVEPPYGWYLDVVPRSSIIKTGYIVANNVGVIDRGYRGEIMVPLLKIDPDAPELELPARVVQMIPRPIVHLGLERVEHSTVSHRGSGGFGSTG